MTAVSAPDALILRYPYRRVKPSTLAVNVAELVTRGTATIDTFTASYPRADYPITGTSANWNLTRRDAMVRITSPAGVLRYEGSCRDNPPADSIPIGGHVLGDTGIALRDVQTIATGDTVTVYDLIVPRSYLSRIDPTTAELYKRWDLSYTDQNENPLPVVNIGVDRQAYVASGGSASFVLDASDSFSWNGNAVTYNWVIPSACTITSGTTASASITVSCPEGQHDIQCVITDSVTTKGKRGHRLIFVNGPNYPAFGDTYPIENLTITENEQGVSIDFTCYGALTTDTLFSGNHVLVTWEYEWSQDGETWVQTSEEALYRRTAKAYLRTWDTYLNADNIRTNSLRAVDLLTYAQDLPIAPQVMIRDDTPANWTQVHSRLMNSAGLVYQVAEFHCSTIFKVADFDFDDFDDVTRENYKITESDVASAMRRGAAYVPGATFRQSLDGRLLMRRSLSYESLAWRAAEPVRWTYSDDDVIEEITYNQNPLKRAGMTEGGCFVDGTPTQGFQFRRALGAQQQGVSRETMQDFMADSESDGQWYVGQHHARINADVASIEFEPIVDVLNVANRDIVQLSITDPTAQDVLTERAQALGQRYAFGYDGDLTHSVMLELETVGGYATTIPLNPVSQTAVSPVKTYTWDFTANDGGWTTEFDGSYVTSEGWTNSTSNGQLEAVYLGSGDTTVTSITITLERMTSGLFEVSAGQNLVQFVNNAGSTTFDYNGTELDTAFDIYTTPFTDKIYAITLAMLGGSGVAVENILINFDVTPSTDVCYLRSVQVTYTGTNNFTGGY